LDQRIKPAKGCHYNEDLLKARNLKKFEYRKIFRYSYEIYRSATFFRYRL
jgi:hypothetical protein